MFWKIFLSNKFGFILETSLFSYWWTAKSLDNAPYTSLKRDKNSNQATKQKRNLWNSKPTRGTIQSDTKLSSATKGTIQSDTNFQVLYLHLKNNNNNQHKKQYKVIQKKFSSATKETIQSAANFQVLFLQKKKEKNIITLQKRTSK